MNRILLVLLAAKISFFFNSCSSPLETRMSEAHEIIVRDNYFTVEWKNPVYLEQTDRIETQRIYIREHGLYHWRFVAEIQFSGNPSYTIRRNDFNPGKYDIGVSIVTVDGDESAIHSSLDYTASPPTGWYIFWIMD